VYHTTTASNCAHLICCFFFSSRRRHTRSKRDWSSDVCSSDLEKMSVDNFYAMGQVGSPETVKAGLEKLLEKYNVDEFIFTCDIRSEERRVGKECRYRSEAGLCQNRTRRLRVE